MSGFTLLLRAMGFNIKPKRKKEKVKNNNENWEGEDFKRQETSINPATGIPMIGCVDIFGNAFGSNYSDIHRSSYDDYHRYNPIQNVFDNDAFNRPW
jgi:hypothetical protein